jgi:PAS domain S-box-containing protein
MTVGVPAVSSRSLNQDSVMAPLAIGAIAILVTSLMATAGWALRAQQQSLISARDQRVELIGSLLGQEAETMLATNDLSRLRREVVETARTWGLASCRIVLSSNQVLADADPRNINVATLPAGWEVTGATNGAARVFPIEIAGRGTARLEIMPAEMAADYWQTSAGVGAVGSLMLAALLMLYRRARSRLRPLWVVREALLATTEGTWSAERLEVDPSLGPEAVAWNKLLDERKHARQDGGAKGGGPPVAPREQVATDLDAACDSMTDGLLLVDSRQRIKFANGAAAVYLRAKREQLLGQSSADVLKDGKLSEAVQSVSSGASQRSITVEVERKEEDGSGVLRFTVRQVRRGDSAAAMIVIEDVTQQRIADTARNHFVAQVAHELRTPLTNIRLYVETAIENEKGDEALVQNALNVINQESRRLERTVSEMLSVSEIEAGSLRLRHDDVHLDVLLEETKTDFIEQAQEKQIKLELSLPPKVPVLQGDRDKIALAVHNLVGNGLKYTAKGGRVSVTLSVEKGKVGIEVTDTGIGIKPEELELVFDRFYRSKDERVGRITGTGLGLTLAREIARLHGGDITLESQIDKGSTFTLSLPLGTDEG